VSLIGISLLLFYLILVSLDFIIKPHPNSYEIVYCYLIPIFALRISVNYMGKEGRQVHHIIKDSMKYTDFFFDVILLPITDLEFKMCYKSEMKKLTRKKLID